jgi:hypothetical protein
MRTAKPVVEETGATAPPSLGSAITTVSRRSVPPAAVLTSTPSRNAPVEPIGTDVKVIANQVILVTEVGAVEEFSWNVIAAEVCPMVLIVLVVTTMAASPM